jgi:hypothetical protein
MRYDQRAMVNATASGLHDVHQLSSQPKWTVHGEHICDEKMNATNVCERCEAFVHQTRRNGEFTGMHEFRRVDTHTHLIAASRRHHRMGHTLDSRVML